jgi:hypothetical protein
MPEVVHLATGDGLITLDCQGTEIGRDFAGLEVASVAALGDLVAVAVPGRGVQRRVGGAWEPLGLSDAQVWAVALGVDGAIYAGLEPAALWCWANGHGEVLDGLDSVEGRADWDSPWGAADLSAVVAEAGRLVVGVEVGGVAVSHDGGVTWTARNDGLYPDVHRVVAVGDTLVASTGLGLFCSRDEGRTWTAADDGLDRGYALGLACSGGRVLAAVASGPPPLWESGGPEAAIFAAALDADPLVWETVSEGFAGAVERQGLDALGDTVVAGTNAGEVLVSTDRGTTFTGVRDGLAPIVGVALADASV